MIKSIKKLPYFLVMVTPVAAELSAGSIAGITIAGVIIFLGGAAAIVGCIVRQSNNNHTIHTHEIEKGIDEKGNPTLREKIIEDVVISTDNRGSPDIGMSLAGAAKSGMSTLSNILPLNLSPLSTIKTDASTIATTDKEGAVNLVVTTAAGRVSEPSVIDNKEVAGDKSQLSPEWFNRKALEDLSNGGGTKVAQSIALANKANAQAKLAEADALLAIALEQQEFDAHMGHTALTGISEEL